MKTTMKHFLGGLLLALPLIFTACSNDDDDNENSHLKDMIVGTWVWNYLDNAIEPLDSIIIDINYPDGRNESYYNSNGVWTKIEGTYRIENQCLTYIYENESSYDIIKCDETSLVAQIQGRTLSAVRATDENNTKLVGTWKCANYDIDSIKFNNATFAFKEDGSVLFSATVDGRAISSDDGKYNLYGNYLVLSKPNQNLNVFLISIEFIEGKGLCLKMTGESENGSFSNLFYKQ